MERKQLLGFIAVMIVLISLAFMTKNHADRTYAEMLQEEQAYEESLKTALTVQPNKQGNVLFSLGERLHVRVGGNYTYTLQQQEKVKKYRVQDTILTYRVQNKDVYVGTLTATVRHVDRGEQIVFTTFKGATKSIVTIPLEIVTKSEGIEAVRFDEQKVKREHDPIFGINKLTSLAGMFRFTGQPYELIASQNYVSHELVRKYDNGDESKVRELVEEVRNVKVKNKDGEAYLSMPLNGKYGELSENWFIVSATSLFANDEAMMTYRDHMETFNIRSHFWLNASGAYTKLPWSIQPGTEHGYGRNLLHQRSKMSLESLQKEDSRFHYAMVINSVNYLLDRKLEGELWQTEYTSMWLKREYGIQAPYTDTRHNENVSLFLTEVGDYLHDPALQNMYFEYADYLANQAKIGNVLVTKNGYFILDYYGKTLTKKTHVSLNHALGEMNFLLQAYNRQPNQQYMNTAIAIKQAIEDTAEAWIRKDNSDFWYQINGDYTFSGLDYESLTLEDLLNTIGIYKTLGLKYDPTLYSTMIGHKVGYLQNADIKMSKHLVEALHAQGYTFLLEQQKDEKK